MSGEELVRHAVAAGLFYEKDPKKLREQIKNCFLHPLGPGRLPEATDGSSRSSIGYLSPHAGYMYSGPIAAHTYLSLSLEKKPETIIIIGPNHTGLGKPLSLAPWREWETPLGRLKVDIELRNYLMRESRILYPEYAAHLYEHSIEVQLPFIQFVYGNDVRILAIAAMDQRPQTAIALAEELIEALDRLGKDAVIIASTDMSHYEPHEIAVEKDMRAFKAMRTLDPDKLYKVIIENNISMCGPLGAMVLMHMARRLGGKEPEILRYATSGDVTGDKSAVVGYLSAVFPR